MAASMETTKPFSPESEVTNEKPKESNADIVYPEGLQFALIVIALCLAVFLVGLDRTIITTAIPRITSQFNSLDDIGWYGSAYLLTSCAFQLIFGKMYTYVSVKWTFLTAIVIFEVGSAVCGAAPNSLTLIIGRAIAGLGCAGVISGALVIISLSMPMQKRPIFTGMIGGVNAVASIAGPLLGGAFTEKITWRWCFYINLPIGAFTLAVIFFLFKDPNRQSAKVIAMSPREKLQQFDLFGTALFIPGITCLLLALQWGGTTYAWSSWRVILLLVIFAVLSVFWAITQIKRGNHATLPPHIISQRSIAFGAFYIFCLGSASLVFTYYLPLWFQAIKNASPIGSGVDFIPTAIAAGICSILGGFITSAIGYYVPLMLVGSVLLSIGAGLFCMLKANSGDALWICAQIVLGAGTGLGIQQPIMAAQTVLFPSDVPIGVSMLIFTQTMGGAIFISVAESLFENELISALHSNVPTLDADIVISNGASGLIPAIQKIGEQYVPGVLKAYSSAVVVTFVVGTVLSAITIIGALGMEWRAVKGSKRDVNNRERDDLAKAKRTGSGEHSLVVENV